MSSTHQNNSSDNLFGGHNQIHSERANTVKMSFLTGFLLLSLVSSMTGRTYAQDLKLIDNGYEGLVVSISEDVPQDQCKRIVHGLKVNDKYFILQLIRINIRLLT